MLLSPWKPETDQLKLALLGKLGEELGELSSAVSRSIIQGITEVHPVTGKSNLVWVQEEIADVRATILMLEKYMHLYIDEPRTLAKVEHLENWRKLIND